MSSRSSCFKLKKPKLDDLNVLACLGLTGDCGNFVVVVVVVQLAF